MAHSDNCPLRNGYNSRVGHGRRISKENFNGESSLVIGSPLNVAVESVEKN